MNTKKVTKRTMATTHMDMLNEGDFDLILVEHRDHTHHFGHVTKHATWHGIKEICLKWNQFHEDTDLIAIPLAWEGGDA